MKPKQKPYRIIGAYDSETCNIAGKDGLFAFPVLHQLGLTASDLQDIEPSNVEDLVTVETYRHASELYARLDEIAANAQSYVPVVCCHNLAFDMYGLSPYLQDRTVKVLAKSCRKPITFTICDDNGRPILVFWDTLVFSQQPLSRMGEDCGYSKAVGEWDYSLIRTPYTDLTVEEYDYAIKDIYVLFAWLGWWIRRNPDIDSSKLGLSVVTKTGVVRERRKVRFANIKGKGRNRTVGNYWHYLNSTQQPKSDDELFAMMAATRGGFTFCASEHASYVYDLEPGFKVIGYDATSMHPAQMVSHKIPVDFKQASIKTLDNILKITEKTDAGKILARWHRPFTSGIYACYEFENVRPKEGSLYKHHGILPLASARFETCKEELNTENQDNQEFRQGNPCKDRAVNPIYEFGKLVSADSMRVYVTELGLWEITQAYDYDSAKAVSGYVTGRFVKPSDMAVISVMQFYKAKNEFKHAREKYYANEPIDNIDALRKAGISDFVIDGMVSGSISDIDVDAEYLRLKADLNALFGIEASNEFRRDTVLTASGIEYTGDMGICNAPKHPKAHYQFGQRIVGWSRIAQHIAMQLLEPYAIDIINGDTDSIKICIPESCRDDAQRALDRLGDAIDAAKDRICKRVMESYPDLFDSLDGIGHYVSEFETDRFCASWNKAYTLQDVSKRSGKREFSFTLAGIPAKRGINKLADMLYDDGMSFGEICDKLLGYNVTYAYDLLHLHNRAFPEWGSIVVKDVADYKGITCRVIEPSALALFPMAKTVNDTHKADNHANSLCAEVNRPTVNILPCMVTERGIYGLGLE